MRNFAELHYQRPNVSDLQRRLRGQIKRLKKNLKLDELSQLLSEFLATTEQYEEMKRLAILRDNSSCSEFYQGERSFFKSVEPDISRLIDDFFELFVNFEFELNPANPSEVALNQRAISTVQLYGPHFRETKTIERELIRQELSRLKEIKKSLTSDFVDSPGLSAILRHSDSEIRHLAWQALSDQLTEGEADSAANYLKLLGLRRKMQEFSGLETAYDYGAMYSRLYFDRQVDWQTFKDDLELYFMPVYEAFKQNLVKRMGPDYLQVDNFLNLVPNDGLAVIPKTDQDFLRRVVCFIDHRLGEGKLFSDLYRMGYIQNQGDLVTELIESPVSLPVSKSAVMLCPDINQTPVDLALHPVLAECGKMLLTYSSLKNYPGQSLLAEAPGAQAMAELGLLSLFKIMPVGSDRRAEDLELIKGINLDEVIDLLLGRFLLLLPSFLLQADFELEINCQELLEQTDPASLWQRASSKYYPDLDLLHSGLKSGYAWQLEPGLLTHPFSSLEFPLALVLLLYEQPWNRNTYVVAEKLNRFLLTNRSLSLAKRLSTSGFAQPKGRDFFRRAAFTLADRLQL